MMNLWLVDKMAANATQYDYHGARVLVTGGSQGIGAAVALAFARSGAEVVITYRSRSDLAQQLVGLDASEIPAGGGVIAAIQADLGSASFSAGRLVNEAASKFTEPGLDILVNNAATAHWSHVKDTDDDVWATVLRCNLTAAFQLTKSALRKMLEQGNACSIVNISSILAGTPIENMCAYSASKAGLEAFTKATALDLKGSRVRANCISPGLIATANQLAKMPTWEKDLLPEYIPAGRFGNANEIASCALWLCSEAAASYVQGAVIPVDGGLSAREAGPKLASVGTSAGNPASFGSDDCASARGDGLAADSSAAATSAVWVRALVAAAGAAMVICKARDFTKK